MKILFVLALIWKAIAWQCGNESWDSSSMNKMSADSGFRFLSSAVTNIRSLEFEPIRLNISPASDFTLESELSAELTNEVIPAIQEFFSDRLKVNRIVGPLKIDLPNCQEVPIPPEHKTLGVANTDVMIYLQNEDISFLSYSARANVCAQESGTRTNVFAGVITINSPEYKKLSLSEKTTLMIHEVLHVLAFEPQIFSTFMKPSGTTYTITELTEAVTVRGVNKIVYKSPEILPLVRQYFGCESLPGLELEEQIGILGNHLISPHWESRLLHDDIMVGALNGDPVFSMFTFTLLADSGWYIVNWNYAENPVFGRNKGCGFINDLCISDEQPSFESEFCTDLSTVPSCNFYHTAEGQCARETYDQNVPSVFQYFSDSKEGGSSSLSDYCPVRVASSESSCLDSSIAPNTYYGETRCSNCKCMVGTLAQVGGVSSLHTGCYELVGGCSSNTPRFRIGNAILGYFEADCTTGGQITAPENSGFTGTLSCPDTNVICSNFPCPSSCYGMGKCNQGVCECKLGRGGFDCSVVCHSSCANCTGSSSNQCTKGCTGSNRVLENGSCICPPGYTEDGEDCTLSNQSCQGLCNTCSSIDATLCQTCVANASRTNDEEILGFCECDPGYIISTTGTSCVYTTIRSIETTDDCQGLCATCNPSDTTQCIDCVTNADKLNPIDTYSSCFCAEGYEVSSAGNSCSLAVSSICQGLCETCSASDPTQCSTCVDNASRSSSDTFGSCFCDGGFDINSDGNACEEAISSTCQGLCETCNASDPTQCSTCVDNASRTSSGTFSSCSCDSGFDINSNGSACEEAISSTCQGLCETCSASDPTQCSTCVDNASRSSSGTFSSCSCDSGFDINSNGSACEEAISSTCQGLCETCSVSDPTQCSTCVDNASRSSSGTFSSCVCSTGFDPNSDGSACEEAISSTCQGLCETCSASDPTQCSTCVDNASRSSSGTFSSCSCDTGYDSSSTGTSCEQTASSTQIVSSNEILSSSQSSSSNCQGLCETCNTSDETECLTCVANSSRLDTAVTYSSCVCDTGYETSSTGSSCEQSSSSNEILSSSQSISSNCQGLCATCNTSNETECLTCVANSSRLDTTATYSSCICDSGYETSSVGTSCEQIVSICQGLCATCSASDTTQCSTCVDNASRTSSGTFSSCICNAGFDTNSTGTSCTEAILSTCQGLCATCSASDTTQCSTCVDNASRSSSGTFSSCICNAGFDTSSTGTSCAQSSSSNCQGLCATCNTSNETECLTCVANSSRLDTTATYSSCICDSGYETSSVGTSCEQIVSICQGLCATCSASDTTQCSTCVDNASRSSSGTFSSCICNAGFDTSSTGTSCAQSASSSCQGLCATCNPSNETECLTCVANSSRLNTNTLYSSCICDSGFDTSSTGTSCVQSASSNCQGLCATCNPSNETECLTCVANSSRLSTSTLYSSCVCDSGFDTSSTGTSCVQSASSNCQGLCETCNPSSSTQCLTCIANSSRLNTNTLYSSCICDAGYETSSTGTSCEQSVSSSCQGLCATCSPFFSTQCSTCVANSSRLDTNLTYSSCICDAGFTRNSAGTSCVQETSTDCQGLCQTCNPSNETECWTCVANSSRLNTNTLYSSCICDAGFDTSSTGTSCIQEPSTDCQGLCQTCNPLDRTECSTCVANSSRLNTNTLYSSCICDDDYISTSVSCVLDISTDCQGLCETCSSSNRTQCLTCKANAYRLNSNATFSSCICNAEYTSTGSSCLRDSVTTCEGLCASCSPLDTSQCATCVDNASREDPDATYSRCVCDEGFLDTGEECIEKARCRGLCATCEDQNSDLCDTCTAHAVRSDPESDFSSCECAENFLLFQNRCAEVPEKPIVGISGPKTVSLSCGIESVFLKGEVLSNSPIVAYTWQVLSESFNQELNAEVRSYNKPYMMLLTDLFEEGTYIFLLIATTGDGNSYSAIHTVQIVSEQYLSVLVEQSYSIETALHDGLIVRSAVKETCYQSESISYQWSFEGASVGAPDIDIEGILSRTSDSGATLNLESSDLPGGYAYMFRITASTGSLSGSEIVQITVSKPNPIAVIKKISGQVTNQEDLILDGSLSYDPFSSGTSLMYKWDCYGACPQVSSTTAETIVVRSSDLMVGAVYKIVLRVREGDRESSDHVEIAVANAPKSLVPKPTSQFNWDSTKELTLSVNESGQHFIWYQVHGDEIQPMHSIYQSSIVFPPNSMRDNHYYAWVCMYFNDNGEKIKKVFAWRTSDEHCLSDLEVVKLIEDYVFIFLLNCEETDPMGEPYKYLFGVEMDNYYHYLSDLTTQQYVVAQVPRGNYVFYGYMCDSSNNCIRRDKEVSLSRLLIEEERHDFIEDTFNLSIEGMMNDKN